MDFSGWPKYLSPLEDQPILRHHSTARTHRSFLGQRVVKVPSKWSVQQGQSDGNDDVFWQCMIMVPYGSYYGSLFIFRDNTHIHQQ